MRIDDLLYFAPGIRFDEVDFSGRDLPEQFRERLEGFYLRPASLCADAGAAFAAGVLVLACIDALARIQIGGAVGERFIKFAAAELPSFNLQERAARLYFEYRNGLIHEARIKKGAQFTLQFDTTLTDLDGVLIINPRSLLHELREALLRFVAHLQSNSEATDSLIAVLRSDHAEDFRYQG